MRARVSALAALAAAARLVSAQTATVEFRVVERHPTPIQTVTGTGNNVLNFAVQARVTGAENTGLASCAFSIQMPGEAETSGTLALNTITDANNLYWTGAINSTDASGGRKAGIANAYRYLVGINPAFNGQINASSGSWTNNPTQQDIGLVTLASAGASYLTYTDPQGHGSPDNPLLAATELQPYFGANGSWIDVYRFQYTVTNLFSNRTIPVNLFVEGGVQVFSGSQFSGGLWGPATQSAASVIVSGASIGVSVLGACCDSQSGLCTTNSAAGCTSGTFQGVGTTCTPGLCPGGACCTIATGACAFTGPSGCLGQRTFLGLGTSCSPTTCPIGRCCAADGSCVQEIQSACAGTWTSGGTCSPNTCPQPGTCCAQNGLCTFGAQTACALDSVWTVGGSCTPNVCPQPGRCCATSGTCSITLQSACGAGGAWAAGSCTPNTCPAPGTCCSSVGGCTFVFQSACSAAWSVGGSCQPNPCPQPGACCSTQGICQLTLQNACSSPSAWAAGGNCSPNVCPQPGSCCMGDGSCSVVLRSACAGEWSATSGCVPTQCVQPHTPVVRAVRAGGPGGAAPWNTATANLQSALSASVAGDEVWIAAGTFTPATSSGFGVPPGVRVYGGFAGTEATRDQRSGDPAANAVVLTGPAAHVLTTSAGAGETVLDRLTVRSGGGTFVGSATDTHGGGLNAVGGALRVSNCRFEQNRSNTPGTASASSGGDGAAVGVQSGCVAVFTSCAFDANLCNFGVTTGCTSGFGPDGPRGGDGGAMAIFDSSCRLIECSFTNNQAGAGVAGGSCSFHNGAGGNGGRGGAIFTTNCLLECTRCTFANNHAGNAGAGGTFNGAGAANGVGGNGGAVAGLLGTMTFIECVFSGNIAGDGATQAGTGLGIGTDGGAGGQGGAIWINAANVNLASCVLWNNTAGSGGAGAADASGCSHPGGAAGTGGAIATSAGTLLIQECTIVGNVPGIPGAGSPTFASGTICSSNPACCQPGLPGATGAGGVAGDTVGAVIAGSILWNNGNNQIGYNAPTVRNSCVQNGWPGVGNISIDPVFVNAAGGDLRLGPASPCIDGGDPSVSGVLEADAAGNNRAVSGCGPLLDSAALPAADMGAYESQGVGADCNADGACDVREVTGVQLLRAPSPGSGQLFGWTTRVRGDVAVIGARGTTTAGGVGAGAAYLYTRHGNVWGGRQTLVAADGAAGDDFGNALAIGDGWMAVAARAADVGGATDAGAVYVFRSSAAGWVQSAKIVAPDGLAQNLFGHGLAIDQDRLVVGAFNGDAPGVADCGAAYVYKFNGAGWALEAKLLPADPTPQKGFGICVSIRGDAIAIGAPYDGNIGSAGGAAYVFQRFGTSWVQVAKLLPTDGDDHTAANFGELVALSDDRLIINAPRLRHTGRDQAGAAYIFRRVGSSWVQERRLTSNAPQAGEWFGFDVAIDGDRVMVGGFRRVVAGQPVAGAAYVFRRFNTTWLMAARIDAPDPAAFGYFGYGIGLSGTRAIVSGYQTPAGAVASAGSARVFDLAALDGNGDGIPDACEIASHQLADVDNNGIPDIVQFDPCRADFNNIGGVTVQDIFDFLNVWFSGDPRGDFNGSGGLEVQDIFDLLNLWFAGC